eukprot:m.290037 g.290037  ORF g.290037 m.290037 type:complete len:55 (-) comp55067_c0_seq14:931-1095(-)
MWPPSPPCPPSASPSGTSNQTQSFCTALPAITFNYNNSNDLVVFSQGVTHVFTI